MTEKPEQIYFVYLTGQKGVRPEKWYGDQTDGHGRSRHGAVGQRNLLFLISLDDAESQLSLDDLVKRYPAPPGAVYLKGEAV